MASSRDKERISALEPGAKVLYNSRKGNALEATVQIVHQPALAYPTLHLLIKDEDGNLSSLDAPYGPNQIGGWGLLPEPEPESKGKK